MLNQLKAISIFFMNYIYIIRCSFLKTCGYIVRNCGQVTTCYGGIQTSLFAGTTFLTFSKHYVNKDGASYFIENIRK